MMYCVDAFDSSDRGAYESWVSDQVAPFIHEDLGGPQDIVTTGPSMGAFHAANFVLRRADLFTTAICMSTRMISKARAAARSIAS